ncbi:unnamed protein product [Orchesella dallaii]|uniref:S-adenosylmethionine sensor upstream of mTORC1 n=1 Tax=Orchesella dallaii TaxID=48710 RepID=A0ABP1QVX7_9HEXA
MDDEQEQQGLVSVLYSVHEKLRLKKRELKADTEWQEAWESHTSDHATLQEYSKAMHALATKIWDPRNKNIPVETDSRPKCFKSSSNNLQSVKLKCRLEWVLHCCEKYFSVDEAKEGVTLHSEQSSKLKLLDVGSCYNPFSKYGNVFDVTAVDLCPAPGFEESIFRCDFLCLKVIGNGEVFTDVTISQFEYDQISVGSVNYRQLNSLQAGSFNVVVFSYFLEYLADPKHRLESCQKAYKLLKPGGLLFILRPDSSKVTPGGNTRLIKMLKLGMVLLGFRRVYFEKLEHLWCMAFKKETEEYISASIASSFFKRDVHKIGIGNIFDDRTRLHELFYISQDLKEITSGNLQQGVSSYSSNKTEGDDSHNLLEVLPGYDDSSYND